jgi:seryl-tRNA synthetase
MIDVRLLRHDPGRVAGALAARGSRVDLEALLELDRRARDLIRQWEELQHARKGLSQEIGGLMRRGQDASAIKAEVQVMGERLKALEAERQEVEARLADAMLELPNIPGESVPQGRDETENPEVSRWGDPPRFPFEPRPHWDLGEALGILDFQRGAKLARSRFTLLRGAGARLERALIQFMLDLHAREHGYTEVLPPFMANRECLVGTGQLPKFEEDLFRVQGWDLYLIPTAEVPVTNIHRDEILEEDALPLYYTAYTPCFRSEAGSHGKDVRGLIRQHQFDKVELVKIVPPESSWDELEGLLRNAEEVLRRLGLHYRVVALCTGDLGFASAKTYDIEVWLAGQGVYREISSCSNFTDFQARRAAIRYRPKGKKGTEFVHTLNGSALAVGRTLVAVLEAYQRADGTVEVPAVLRPYMGGMEVIRPERRPS